MVVVTDSWVKNVNTFPTPAMNEMEMIVQNEAVPNQKVAKAILVCRPNSHPFQDRTLLLDEPIKIGRSVARAKAKNNNAIFDCKVLSRNHAILWYDNGKFFLQDTKSSNGTFVNNNKLASESEHHEVSSGDIVQFGVDVVENSRKVTHGCIIAVLKLYLPDGKEAKASPSVGDNNKNGTLALDELYKLNEIIQDAFDREAGLQKKLVTLQFMLQSAKIAIGECWAACIGEERLLSRIATLETQLSQACKNWNEDRCKQELTKMQDENVAYQVAAIEALEKVHDEKLRAVTYATELETKENIAQHELEIARNLTETLHRELNALAEKSVEEQKKSNELLLEYEKKIADLQAELEEKQRDISSFEQKLGIDKKTTDCNILNELERKFRQFCEENEETDRLPNGGGESNHIQNTLSHDQSDVKEGYSSSENGDDGVIENEDATTEVNVEQKRKPRKDVTFDLPDEDNSEEKSDESLKENDTKQADDIDSKTLKYHFQTAQNELLKRIESLEQQQAADQARIRDMETTLDGRKRRCTELEALNEIVAAELKSCKELLDKSEESNTELKNEVSSLALANRTPSRDDLVLLEEELVHLKERFAQVNEQKANLHRSFESLKKQYDNVRSRSHNMTFLYIAPLIVVVLYLLFIKMFS